MFFNNEAGEQECSDWDVFCIVHLFAMWCYTIQRTCNQYLFPGLVLKSGNYYLFLVDCEGFKPNMKVWSQRKLITYWKQGFLTMILSQVRLNYCSVSTQFLLLFKQKVFRKDELYRRNYLKQK